VTSSSETFLLPVNLPPFEAILFISTCTHKQMLKKCLSWMRKEEKDGEYITYKKMLVVLDEMRVCWTNNSSRQYSSKSWHTEWCLFISEETHTTRKRLYLETGKSLNERSVTLILLR
jgi:hypothetical protein